MSLKTKFFGKKVRGQELTNLMDALKIDKRILINRGEKMTTENYWGKCSVKPKEDGLDVDLYVFRKDFHIVEDSDIGFLGNDDSDISRYARALHGSKIGDKKFSTSKFHYQEKIPYNKINL